MNLPEDSMPLGQSGLMVSCLGLGAWAWGDRLFWSYGREYQEVDIQEAYTTSRLAGVNFFDTAEVYGQGRSESLLGNFVRSETTAEGPHPVIATKFMPYPWRLRRSSLTKALQASLKRLGLPAVDLYQIHWPFPPLPVETWAQVLAEAVQNGLARSVGVSNYSEEQMRRACLALEKRGVHLASNQVEYNLLNRKVELNGLLQACQDLGITLIAYSPLAQGVLSGKYTPENPPTGFRGQRYSRAWLARIQPLLRRMREIGFAHGGKTPSQVALNWVICKGGLPIPGAKTARQAQDNAGALGWRLDPAEVTELDRLSAELHPA